MSFAPSSSLASGATAPKKFPEIITIPEQFYEVALKLKSLTSAERDEAARTPPPPPPSPKPTAIVRPPEPRHVPWSMIGVVAGVILLSGGGFVFFNRDALFRKQVAVVTPPPVIEPIPLVPNGLLGTASQGAVSLSWTDTANNELGYYIERKDTAMQTPAFVRITTLPANSTAFIDVTIQPSTAYAYRVIATGQSGDSAASNEVSLTTFALPVQEAPKPTFPPGGLDTDSDGLTDMEEALYGTAVQKPDSDNDRFLDGNEVFHLYNPATTTSVKLLESGLVRTWSSMNGWVMYVPTSWTSMPDETDTSRQTLQTGKGERFVISVESNPSKQELIPWAAARMNQPAELLGEFTTKGGLRGVYAPDRMQAWLAWGDAVFHISYDLETQPFVNFRTTLEMMLNSLSLNGAAVITTTLTPANSGPGSLLNLQASSTVSSAPVVVAPSSEPIATTSSTLSTASTTSSTLSTP